MGPIEVVGVWEEFDIHSILNGHWDEVDIGRILHCVPGAIFGLQGEHSAGSVMAPVEAGDGFGVSHGICVVWIKFLRLA